jgi:hypothetical protein
MLTVNRSRSISVSICRSWLAMSTNVHTSNDSDKAFGDRLHFDNRQLSRFPVEVNPDNYVRKVPNSFYSRVRPTPLEHVQLVAHSSDALQLIDLTDDDAQLPEFAEYFAGNRLWTGSDPAAHCYCGHQVRTRSGVSPPSFQSNNSHIVPFQISSAHLPVSWATEQQSAWAKSSIVRTNDGSCS